MVSALDSGSSGPGRALARALRFVVEQDTVLSWRSSPRCINGY